MSNGNTLLKPHTRKWFFVSCIVTLFLLIVIRYFVIPEISHSTSIDYYKITNTIIDNFIVAIVVTMSISVIILFLNPPVMEKSTVEVVGPFELKNILNSAFDNVREFYYIGHTAKWTRSFTMKELSKYAKNNNVSVDVFIVILDPESHSSSCFNAEFQKRIKSIPDSKDTIIKNTKIELFTTIVSMNCWNAEGPLLNIKVALTEKISLFRIDLFSKFVVITQADPRPPSLKYDFGTVFYNSYREEARIRFNQSREIPLTNRGILFKDLSCENVKQLLSELGFDLNGFNQADFENIINKSQNPVRPY